MTRANPFVAVEVPFDEGEIELVYPVFADHAREVTERIAMEGGDDHAGSILVEAVGDGGLEIQPFALAPFPEVFHEAFAGARPRAGLACESRGLVDDDVIFGLDDNIEFLGAPAGIFFGRGFCLAPCSPARRGSGCRGRSEGKAFPFFAISFYTLQVLVNADGVAFGKHLVRLADDSVHAYFFLADDGEEHRQGLVGKRLAEEPVQAHVGEVSVDNACNHAGQVRKS